MSGQPCLDPKNHPVPTDAATETIYKLLNEDSVGCAKITGQDTGLAKKVDFNSWTLFMKSNTETMNANTLGTNLFAFYTKSTITMDLYARDRIAVKCTTGCATNKEFHFGTSAAALFT